MASKSSIKTYALEVTGIFVVGLGTMLLLVISVWLSSLVVAGSSIVTEEAIGAQRFDTESDRFAFWRDVAAEPNSGRVAGIVDDSSELEDNIRNEVADWLGSVRNIQSLPIAYRDGVLDRNAQNQARFIATSCSADRYSDWDESLGLRIDEGFTTTFSESIFDITGENFASDLPNTQSDYARLFTTYDAIGVGVAEYAEAELCGDGYVMVIHAASVR